ncbi:MAG: PEGA domain-containing protein [Gammaproteobacteria bacterium]
MTRPQDPPAPGPLAAARPIEPAGYRPPGGFALPAPRLPWRRLALATLFGIALWAAWYVLTARSVGIRTVPADAAVSVLEWPAIGIGEHWLLRPGARRVRASAPGHVTFDGVIEVGSAQLQTHHLELERLPGLLQVSVAPVKSAELLLDGRSLGTVPGLIGDVPAGQHDIEVRAPRYQSFHVTLEIEGKGIEQNLAATLEPAWADLTIASLPAGASVRVDGELHGQTPATLELLAGRRVIELVQPGYKTWRQTLAVIPGQPIRLGEVVLAPADGELALASEPPGANVTVDGEFRGRTPLTLALAPGADHRVRLLKEGYTAHEADVALASGARETRSITLAPELATLILETSPADAELLVDGEPRGTATQTLELTTIAHELTVRAPGYATWQDQVTPRKGVAKRLRIRLKTAAEMAAEGAAQAAAGTADRPAPRRAATDGTPPRGEIATALGQVLKLFHGGAVTLGSGTNVAPARPVTLARPFYLGVREVTNAEFRHFLATHHTRADRDIQLDADSQPVGAVSWTLAASYCNWLSRRDGLPPFYRIRYGEVLGVDPGATGYRLPTEAEWEWAARTTPDGTTTGFAWGDAWPPAVGAGNFADDSARGLVETVLGDYRDGHAGAAPVASFAPNTRGLFDLGGNVAEWVHDVYTAPPAATPGTDPMGPPAGDTHVVKGASWASAARAVLQAGARAGETGARADLGFRLARYAQ